MQLQIPVNVSECEMEKLCLIFKDGVKGFKAAEMTLDLTGFDSSKGCALHLGSSKRLHCLSNPHTECVIASAHCSGNCRSFRILAYLNMQNM